MKVVFLLLLVGTLTSVPAAADTAPTRMQWQLDGVTREALVFPPSQSSEAGQSSEAAPPLIFGFHGHGGNMRNAARTFAFHQHWPEAVVVYMQGVPTPGMTDPEGKRNGWQKVAGDHADRDLVFFDAVLKTMKEKFHIDERRVYVSGHSNGGGFTYLLWATRHDNLAAVAPSAAGARNLASLKPLPCFHVAGQRDSVVPFSMQQRVMEVVRQVNQCSDQGQPWAKDCTIYESKAAAPFVSLIHDGTHKYHSAAPGLIVKFFKEHARPMESERP